MEALTENGWETWPSLPTKINSHCMVNINSTTVMVIGGIQGKNAAGKTFLLDISQDNKNWIEGPELHLSRKTHSCGKIKKSKDSDKFRIIVVGGVFESMKDDSTAMNSVEILNEDNKWQVGPNLSIGVRSSLLVEKPDGGVLLVGGITDHQEKIDTIFQLSHADDEAWTQLPQKLKRGRDCHVAFLIPDEITSCR